MSEFAINLTNNSTKHSRRDSDFYSTPPSATFALLDFLCLPDSTIIWEPACGKGKISEVLKFRKYTVISTDLHDYKYGEAGIDFTLQTQSRGTFIITNPPFKESEKFIETAAKLQIKGFAFLLKSQYWHAKKRYELFNKYKPAFILPLTWRLDFLEGERGGNPTMECLWTVWIRGSEEARYIPLSR